MNGRTGKTDPTSHDPVAGTGEIARPGVHPQQPEPAEHAWHTLSADAVVESLATGTCGLSDDEAASRLERFGYNRLPRERPPTIWQIVLRQFKSPLIYVLAAAAVVSLALGDLKDAGFICGVLVINAIIGTIQESRAEHASQALQKLLTVQATVSRAGQVREMDAEQLVPGDVVLLESGNRVPADARLIDAHGLEIDESLLTGESAPVSKVVRWAGSPDTPLADRENMVHAGSMVARGRCHAVVVSTGVNSAIGHLAMDVLGLQGHDRPAHRPRVSRRRPR